MAKRVPGGRKTIGGISMSEQELRLIDRAVGRHANVSRAEFIRNAALAAARADLATTAQPAVRATGT